MPTPELVDEGVTVVDEYFQALNQKDFDKALSYYSPEFFKTTSREKWLEALKTVNSKLGDYKAKELTYGKSQRYYGANMLIVLDYSVSYSKNTSQEYFSLIKSLVTKDVKILSHTISSTGL